MKHLKIIVSILCGIIYISEGSAESLPKLDVSSNHRYLVQIDDEGKETPFFFMADTGWELFTRLTKAEVEEYFQVRMEQGYNVVIADDHNEYGYNDGISGIDYPNREGYAPFTDSILAFTPEGIEEAYWDHIGWVIDKAAEYQIYIMMLPYFGNRYVQKEWEPIINSTEKAYNWGYFLGEMYGDRTNMIWALGGDFAPQNYYTKAFDNDEYQITIATAEGIADGINGDVKQFDDGNADYTTSLMTYHINDGYSSSDFFHDADFLDFNSIQSGHKSEYITHNYFMIEEDYQKTPIKPTIDIESWYEYIMLRKNGQWVNPRCSAYDVRRNAYRSFLAGGFGVSYGNNNVWMFFKKDQNYVEKYNPTNDWNSDEGIYSEGGKQMAYLKELLTSLPWYLCQPAQNLITDPNLGGNDEKTHIQASKAEDNSFALIYIPGSQDLQVDLTQLNGDVSCSWFNPETGKACDQSGINDNEPFLLIDETQKTSSFDFETPSDHDWILLLEAESLTSNKNLNEFENIRIYPNPVNSHLHFLANSDLNQPCEIYITDILGKTILHKHQKLSDGINMSRFPNGLYLVRIMTNKQIKIFKITKK